METFISLVHSFVKESRNSLVLLHGERVIWIERCSRELGNEWLYDTITTWDDVKDSTDRLSKALVGERELIKVVCYYSSSNGSSWDGNL